MSNYSGRGMYFDRQGQPMEMMEWARAFGDHEGRIVGQHWVRGWMVSTVWLGINHNFNPFSQGPPLIFGTMIFPPGDDAPEGDTIGPSSTRALPDRGRRAGWPRPRAGGWSFERLGPDSVKDITGPLVDASSDTEWDGSVEGEM